MVLTFGMSMPFSMMVVASSTSKSPRVKACMRRDSSSSSIWPWPTVTRTPGTIFLSVPSISSIDSTRL